MTKLPPYMAAADGYCYSTTWQLVQSKDLTPWYGAVSIGGFAIVGSQPEGPWKGQTVACIGSGPSLTREDCQRVQSAGLKTITANDSFKLAPFTDVVCAVDHGWWQQHMHEINIPAQLWTTDVPAAQEFDLHLFITRTGMGNSGARAAELAITLGASRVLLLGFDCSLKHGVHWHGKHTRTGNPDEGTIGRWLKQFDELAQLAKTRGVEILNCSRETALECFAREDLCAALQGVKTMEPAGIL